MKYYVNIHYCKKHRIIDFTQIKQVKINTSFRKNINSKNIPEFAILQRRHGASDIVTEFSAIKNSGGAQNIFCLGLCG